MSFAVLMLCAAHAVNPSTRVSDMVLLVMVMAFAMFLIEPKEARQLTAFTLLSYRLTMALLAFLWPDVYPPSIQFLSYLVLVAVVLTVSTLASQVAGLRASLRKQRNALKEAVATLEQLSQHDALTGLSAAAT